MYRILLVDDEPLILAGGASFLEGGGYFYFVWLRIRQPTEVRHWKR